MRQLPTWWYRTEYLWIGMDNSASPDLLEIDHHLPDYPHWQMQPELKSYYLMQAAYWCQQLLVLVLGLEKPRKDYYELVAHHIVTLWLIGYANFRLVIPKFKSPPTKLHAFSWSYLVNMTLTGNAVYLSMDLPDALLAVRASCKISSINFTLTNLKCPSIV